MNFQYNSGGVGILDKQWWQWWQNGVKFLSISSFFNQYLCYLLDVIQFDSSYRKMTDNFKYEDYEEDFQANNASNVQQNNKPPSQQPQTIKMLGRETKKQTETQVQKPPAPPTDTSTKSKLIDQHNKLKSQLKELASKMDEILEKERERKKKKLKGEGDEDDERIIQMKKKLKDDEIKMLKIKSQVTRLRKNMDNKYDLNKIVDKQNQLKHLQKQLQVLEEQKQSLQKIRKTQDKALRNEDDKQSKNKKQRMEEQLRQITAQTKKQLQTINEKQKQVRKLHESYIMKSEKVKQIQAKLNEKKKNNQQDEITPEAIAKIQEELKEIEAEKAVIEKDGNQKMRNLEKQRRELKMEMERKKLILQQKQKQLRLNQMKHKEIIRLINSNQQQQLINESRIEKENKSQAKRVVPKKGRDVPNMQLDGEEETTQQKTTEKPKQEIKTVTKPERHQYGFSANLDDEGIIDD